MDNIDKKEKKYSFYLILILFPILIFLGKVIRYTIMKTVLVNTGIGNGWIGVLNSNLSNNEILNLTFAGEQNGTAILFFKYINILNLNSYADFEIFISIVFNLILLMLFFKCKSKINLSQFIFIVLSISILNIFDFCLSKEPVQMLLFVILFYILISKKIKHKELCSMIMIFISAIIFRKYYILIIFFAYEFKIIFNCFFSKDKPITVKKIIITLLIILCSYILILLICKYFFNNIYTELVRVRNRTSDANTDIRNFIYSDNLFIMGINYLINLVRMLFPIELLFKGPKYILYVIYQILITVSLISALKKYRNGTKTQKIPISIFVGYIFTSATFEPDFGSWIRHEAVLFPILLIINGIVSDKTFLENKIKKEKKSIYAENWNNNDDEQ